MKNFGGRPIGKPIWMPEGDALVMPVQEAGRGQLWSVDYPSGEMHRFTNDLSNYALDLDGTHDGKILAGVQSTRSADVWIAPSGDAGQARQLTSGGMRFERVTAGPAGKLLLSNGDIWLMDNNGGQTSLIVSQGNNAFAISSCGDRYIVFDSYRDNQLQLWRADADGSNGIRLANETLSSDCTPDGKSVFYANRKLYRLPIEGGAPSEVLTTAPEKGIFIPAVSPDGSLVAVTYQEGSPTPVLKIGVVPLRFISQLPTGQELLRWSPDGKGLQYLLTRNGATNVWEQPLSGGEPHQVTKFTSGRIFSFAWSRDGKQLLLSRGNETSDVILISNFR